MAKEFHPHVGKGLLPDQTVKYIIHEGKITTMRGLFGGKATETHMISANTSVNIQNQSLVSKMRTLGDVVVSTGGSSVTYERIKPAGEFARAVEKEKERLAKEERNSIVFSNENLEDFVVLIPKPPDNLPLLDRAHDYNVHISKGDVVEGGDTIAHFKWPLKAPFSGRVHYAGVPLATNDWNAAKAWPTTSHGAEYFVTNLSDCMLVGIQPLKGENISGCIQKTYSEYLESASVALQRERSLAPQQLAARRYAAWIVEDPNSYFRTVDNLIQAVKRAEPRFYRSTELTENTNHRTTSEVFINPFQVR
jgi:hypothetical protein